MKLGSRRTIHYAVATMIVCLMGIALARGQNGQPAAGEKPLMSEDVFKNLQVLRGIPVKEFMGTMGFFAASLSLNCTDCHVSESSNSWARYADDTQLKNTARRMVLMMNAINKGNFEGMRMVTCYSCHRGNQRPEITPSLAEQYGTPPPEDPRQNRDSRAACCRAVPPIRFLINTSWRLAGPSNWPSSRAFPAKGLTRDSTQILRRCRWRFLPKLPISSPRSFISPMETKVRSAMAGRRGLQRQKQMHLCPVLPLAAGDLEGAKVDAELSFPARIKQDFTSFRVGFPATTIGDRQVQIVEGTTSGGSRVKLYFDKQSGLLVRQVRFTNTLVGLIPMHIEYSDYRLVSGVKIPFHWVITWTDGQGTIQLATVQAKCTD